MAFWDGKPASAAHLRLFEPTQGWRAHDDVLDGEGRTSAQGSCRSVELACQSAFKFDPVSASNFDPLERRVLTVALASSELAGVAETGRARVV